MRPARTKYLRMPGVEPGSQAWEACMMPLHYMRWCMQVHDGSPFNCDGFITHMSSHCHNLQPFTLVPLGGPG